MSLISLDKEYVAPTYGRFPVELVSGKGCLLQDTQGKEYIDLTSGIGVTAFGQADTQWVAAVTEQLGKLQHCSNLYYTEPCAKLAELLCQKTGMKKVFFSNSGAEANECAIKYARKYSATKKGPDCYTIVSLQNSFHGRTLTTLSATGQDVFHKDFLPLTPGFAHVRAGDLDALAALTEKTPVAGILLECVQGEGGVVPLSAEYIQGVAKLCSDKDIPLMIDEVQTGNGRTGKLYSYMHYGITPDIVSTAKGLGGGLPIGATLLGEKVEKMLGPGDHGSTYGGNPIACAAAYSVVSRLEDDFLAQVQKKSDYIFSRLQGAPGIEKVTGLGLMIGITTTKNNKEIVNTCIENGVLCLTAKEKVRLLPALNIPDEQLSRALDVLLEACK